MQCCPWATEVGILKSSGSTGNHLYGLVCDTSYCLPLVLLYYLSALELEQKSAEGLQWLASLGEGAQRLRCRFNVSLAVDDCMVHKSWALKCFYELETCAFVNDAPRRL